jgi:hypothetical protein
VTQCNRCGLQGCSRGDDIVDHDDPASAEAGSGDEFGTVEALDSRPTGLRGRCRRPHEQPSAGNAELAGNVSSDQFALIEAPRSAPSVAGGRPRDQVEIAVIASCHDGIHHQSGEVTRHLTTVAILEAEYDLAGASGERQRGAHTVRTGPRPRSEQGKSTGGAHRSTWGVTSGTTNLEHHEFQCDEGVSQR